MIIRKMLGFMLVVGIFSMGIVSASAAEKKAKPAKENKPAVKDENPGGALEQAKALSKDIPKNDAKPADMTKKVKVFIMMGQSNMVGMGKPGPEDAEGSLENFVKAKGVYQFLLDESGKISPRNDVRCAMVTCDIDEGWLAPGFGAKDLIGPELGFGHVVGNYFSEPVLIIKACIGNRSLGWDLLPPGSERYEVDGKVYAGYKDGEMSWNKGSEPGSGGWYAGKQYDDDTANAKSALASLANYYPGANGYEVVGFVFWQGEKDGGNAVHAANYEKNLVKFIKALRKDFDAPNAKFVLATLGEAKKGGGGNGGKILEAHLAVDGKSGKYPDFKGNVASVYSNPISFGGSGNGHYGGNAGTYMNVGIAMGKSMVELFKSK
jgi:Carbohydrate esterase, sialic acid-specific acetylesterase